MEEIELHNWAAYSFGRWEVRLVGYNTAGHCTVTEPVVHARPTFVIETADGKSYRVWDPIQTSDKIDMMYVIDRFCNINGKSPPRDITESFIEEIKEPK